MSSLLKALARAYGGGSDTAICRVKFERDGEPTWHKIFS